MRDVLRAQDANAYTSGSRTAKTVQDDPLREWRAKWREILKHACIYFDSIPHPLVEYLKPFIQEFGSTIQPFFDQHVTHVISENHGSEVCMKAKDLNSKVYTLEKMTRFLSSLLGRTLKLPEHDILKKQNIKLAAMLENDANTASHLKNNDFYTFKGPYVLVFDPSFLYRASCVKEWKPCPIWEDGQWPQLRKVNSGISPFAALQHIKSEKRRFERLRMHKVQEDANEEIDEENEHKRRKFEDKENVPQEQASLVQPSAPTATATPSVRLREFGEIVASGVPRYSQTSKLSNNEKMQSRELQQLRRKVMPQPVTSSQAPQMRSKPVPKKPGWCENCLERYEDLLAHVASSSHRNFALNDQKFAALDAVIAKLQR